MWMKIWSTQYGNVLSDIANRVRYMDAMLVMNLPLNDDGEWGIDYNKAVNFYHNLDHVLPEEIGSVLSPMPIDKISFERSHTGDVDTVADAENNLFTAAGVSSLLFNNPKAKVIIGRFVSNDVEKQPIELLGTP